MYLRQQLTLSMMMDIRKRVYFTAEALSIFSFLPSSQSIVHPNEYIGTQHRYSKSEGGWEG